MTTSPGPLAEEAARFVEALSDWARTHAGDAAGAVGAQFGAQAGSHIGNGVECRLCPVCQALNVLRSTKPETFAHLLDASAALTAALRSVVESHAHGDTRGGVQRIDLDDSEV